MVLLEDHAERDEGIRQVVRDLWEMETRQSAQLLMPLPIPEQCWQVVSMDFITGLPVSEEYDAIMTVVVKLSKRSKFSQGRCVVRHHGLPEVIISDRDSKFTSKF